VGCKKNTGDYGLEHWWNVRKIQVIKGLKTGGM
jgi:hypothetical protein